MAVPLRYNPASVRRGLRERARRITTRPTPLPQPGPARRMPFGPKAVASKLVGGALPAGLPIEPPGIEPTPAPAPGPLPGAPPPPAPAPGPGQGGGPLSWNPQLETHPLGRFTDAQYEADIGSLAGETTRKYQAVLRKLGYMDPATGQFVKGTTELAADRERAGLNREMGLAREQSTFDVRDLGSLFSGYRGVAQARAEHPFVTGLSDLDIGLSTDLTGLTQEATDILGQFVLDRNALLAGAAGRYDPGNPTGPLPSEVLGGTPEMPTFQGPAAALRTTPGFVAAARRAGMGPRPPAAKATPKPTPKMLAKKQKGRRKR